MNVGLTTTLTQRIAAVHAQLLAAASPLAEDQLTRRLAPNVPSIGWHLWHIARWADRVHAVLPRMVAAHSPQQTTVELWAAESLASRWGFERATLGYGETGMEMTDDAASALRFPDRDTLADYARRAFAAAEATVAGIGDDQLAIRGPDLIYAGRLDRERTLCEAVVGHLGHASRHLGMMEGIRPFLSQKPGTITF